MKTNIHTKICVLCVIDSRYFIKNIYINVHIENKFFSFHISAVNQPTQYFLTEA